MSSDSVSALRAGDGTKRVWVDMPMRGFDRGFYRNLTRMYDHLGVRYASQRFVFSFAKLPSSSQAFPEKPEPFMFYSSNFHQLPPVPRFSSLLRHLLETASALFLLCLVPFLLSFRPSF